MYFIPALREPNFKEVSLRIVVTHETKASQLHRLIRDDVGYACRGE